MSLTIRNGPRADVPIPPSALRTLPPGALQRLRNLVDRAEAAHDAWRGSWDRQIDSQERMSKARVALEDAQLQLSSTPRALVRQDAGLAKESGNRLVADPRPVAAVKAAENALLEATAEHARRCSAADAASALRGQFTALIDAAGRYCAELPVGAKLTDVPVLQIKLKADPQAQLDAARQAIEELMRRRQEVTEAPPAQADTRAMLEREVEKLAREGAPLITAGGVFWPKRAAEVISDGASIGVSIPAALAVQAWLDPAFMIDRLVEEADAGLAASGRQPGLAAAERMAALDALAEQVLEAERLEQGIIAAMSAANIAPTQRQDADIRAVLAFAGPAMSS